MRRSMDESMTRKFVAKWSCVLLLFGRKAGIVIGSWKIVSVISIFALFGNLMPHGL